MQFSDDLLRELLATFAVEAQEHLLAINQHMLALEKGPGPDKSAELLAEIFRAAHSLKGAARAVNLEAVGDVAHRLETLFARLRDGEIAPAPELFDLVYEALDALNFLVQTRSQNDPSGVDVAALCARLEAAGAAPAPTAPTSAPSGARSLAQRLQRSPKPAGPQAAVPSAASKKDQAADARPVADGNGSPNSETAVAPVAPLPIDARAAAGSQAALPHLPEPARPRLADTTVRLSIAKLDALMEVVGELQAARLAAEQRLAELRSLLENAQSWEALSRAVRQRARRLRLAAANPAAQDETEGRWRASAAWEPAVAGVLLDFVETNDGRVRAMRGRLSDLRRQFEADGRHLAQLMADLQDDVRRTRLLPISTVLDAFPRVVRDLARQLDKEVSLEISGGDTEVDRAMLEQIKDPLTHLVRNSVDHGLETPAARMAAGKPAVGRLTLSAAQLGDSLRIEVSDDGAGIDVARVKAGAVQRGLVTAEAAASMTGHEALWLIFRSGLSTSPIITAISGRGVGLDVVRENIERLNGWIDVDSVPGRGTRFAFSLPLTVATTLCLMAQAGGQTFGLPVSSVLRVVRVGAEQIGHAEGGEAIRVDGRPLALSRLADVLDIQSAPPGRAGALQPAIVLGSAERRAAFLVDSLGVAQEVVVKSLPQPFERVRHISGAAILGSGEVALILNAADMLRSGKTLRVSETLRVSQAEAAQVVEAPVVLVADDSITTRTLEKNILEAAGYRVRVAADGAEAWTELQTGGINLLVSDINMPRMNGFELTEKVRGDEKLKTLPIILVTSLDSREDRERGIWAGADAYIVKGAFDQDVLLGTIRQLI
jgi:two-component system chemotaxis sensor kinase CheA